MSSLDIKTSSQPILKIWTVPSDAVPNHSNLYIGISKDKQWWFGIPNTSSNYTPNQKVSMIEIYKRHPELYWEPVRQHLINKLLPTLEPSPLYNELDRFTDLG